MRTCEKLFQQLVGSTPIGDIQPTASYAKQIVEELMGLEIHDIGIPHFNIDYLCLENVLVNTKTGKAEPFNSEVFVTRRTAYSYDPEAKCPNFDNFISSFCNNQEDRKYFLRA